MNGLHTHPFRLTLLSTSLAALLLLAGGAHGQQLYRSVGPDGRVTYSDKPPATANASPGGSGASAASSNAAGNGSLPYALRQVVQRYPVTLYASADCAPCNSGRNLLINRGVPFSEKTVSSNDDVEALKRLTGGEASVPLLTIGSQQLKGYSDADWSQYLDAAGYPKTSQLPASYRRPEVTPMVGVQSPVTAGAPETPATSEVVDTAPAAPSPSVAPERTTDNPAGIRF